MRYNLRWPISCWFARYLGWLNARRAVLHDAAEPPAAPRAGAAKPANGDSTDDLVGDLIGQRRAPLLLRNEIVHNLSSEQVRRARAALREDMSIVPAGTIRLGGAANAAGQPEGELAHEEIVIQVGAFLLDRCCVSNEQYKQFVDSGAYEEMSIWEPEIWPGVLDFVDQTGVPGPRYWRNGTYPAGLERHPVVGVSWYEASAYARWSGKRLPSDPEWEKTASWPAQLTASPRQARRFPWGDAMDPDKANLWSSGVAATVPVDEFAAGASVSGVLQLIGNVWEWTASRFGGYGFPAPDLVLTAPLKSIRGAAFDTYFENHATCQFQSGEEPTSRQANLGFRCAVSLSDVDLFSELDETETQSNLETDEASLAEEVAA